MIRRSEPRSAARKRLTKKEAGPDEFAAVPETETAMTGRQTELVGMGYLTDAKAYLKAGNALSRYVFAGLFSALPRH
jgi:hypothetical protein